MSNTSSRLSPKMLPISLKMSPRLNAPSMPRADHPAYCIELITFDVRTENKISPTRLNTAIGCRGFVQGAHQCVLGILEILPHVAKRRFKFEFKCRVCPSPTTLDDHKRIAGRVWSFYEGALSSLLVSASLEPALRSLIPPILNAAPECVTELPST